jgi:hypothetical protein
MTEWKPKDGTGWHRRVRDGIVHYGLMLDGNGYGETLFLTLGPDDLFIIGYSPNSFEYKCPRFEHVQRIQLDFGVPAWRVKDVIQTKERIALVLQAVRRP